MPVHQISLDVSTEGPGTYEITDRIAGEVRRSGVRAGIASVFCRHTSCSLVVFENADPSARADLEDWFQRMVPADDPHYTHTAEGADDMPSHIRTVLARTSETIPFADGRLLLGTWQGIFVWEHRCGAHRRSITLTVLGE